MSQAQHIMGGSSVFANTAGVNFEDGTSQATAAQPLAGVTSDLENGVVVTYPLTYGGVTMPSGDPNIGDALTIVSPGQAGWQAPSAKQTQTARVPLGVIASATPSTPPTVLNWTTPFADNNYTVTGSVTVAETPSDGAATAICCIGMIQYQPGGAGIVFVVCNADGVTHDVTAQFIAIHD